MSGILSLALTNHTSILLITDITSSHWSIGSIHLLTELIAAASLASLPQESAAFSSLTVSSLPALVSKTSQSRSCCGARAIIIFVHTLLVPGSKCLHLFVLFIVNGIDCLIFDSSILNLTCISDERDGDCSYNIVDISWELHNSEELIDTGSRNHTCLQSATDSAKHTRYP